MAKSPTDLGTTLKSNFDVPTFYFFDFKFLLYFFPLHCILEASIVFKFLLLFCSFRLVAVYRLLPVTCRYCCGLDRVKPQRGSAERVSFFVLDPDLHYFTPALVQAYFAVILSVFLMFFLFVCLTTSIPFLCCIFSSYCFQSL